MSMPLLSGSSLCWLIFQTMVSAPPPARDDPSAVGVIELGLPGQSGAPSAYKVSLAEVLAGQPGVQIRSSGGLGQWSGALLRGADSSQVAVLIDGVPLQRGAQAAIDLSLVPVDGAERVEVYRGVPPLEVGMDAIGGAINLISRRGMGAKTTWALLGSGSFGLRKLIIGQSGQSGGLHVAATLSYQGATGDFPYLSNGGLIYTNELHELRRRNDGFDQGVIEVRLSGETGRGSYFLGVHGVFKQQGVASIGQAAAQPGQPTLSLGRALVNGGGQADLLSGRLQLALDAHALLERSALRDLGIVPPSHLEQLSQQTGLRTIARLFRDRQVNPEAALAAATNWAAQTLVLIGELRYEHLSSTDLCPAPRQDCVMARPTTSERLRGLWGLGGELRFLDDRLLIAPGVHALLARSLFRPVAGALPLTEEPAAVFQSFLAPRLSARWHVTKWLLLRMGGGRFVRLPTFLELFGDGAFFRSNVTLRPESAWLVEAGGRLQGPAAAFGWLRGSLEAHGFLRRIDDFINSVRIGPGLRAFNVGQVQTAGVELAAQIRLRDLVSVQTNYTFLDARDRSTATGSFGNLLPGRPAHSVFLRLDLAHRGYGLGYELDYTSLVYLDPGNLQPRPPRALHALRLQSGPHGDWHISLSIEIRNLADTRALPVRLPLSGNQERLIPLADIYDYPLPGRSVYATLAGRLQ